MKHSSFTTYRHFCTGSPESIRKKGKSAREKLGRSILKAENLRTSGKKRAKRPANPNGKERADAGVLARRAHALPWLPSVLLPRWERSKRRR